MSTPFSESEARIIKAAFSTPDGALALQILRERSGFDRRTLFCEDERKQCHCLGRASLFHDIMEAMNDNQIRSKNGRPKRKPQH